MLYCSDPLQIKNCGLLTGASSPLPSSNVVVDDSVGNEYPSAAVIPNGRRNFIDSGRKPKPWPPFQVGVRVVKGSAPTARFPVPPQLTTSAAVMAVSLFEFRTSW